MIQLTQRPYWEHVIHRFSLEHVPPRNTPLPTGIILDNNMSPKTESEKREMDDKPYRAILGSIMWGQLATRPDLAFAISLLARFQANPGIEHWNALMHVTGYIKNTMDYGITYSRDNIAYVDADYYRHVDLDTAECESSVSREDEVTTIYYLDTAECASE